ncbi:hypothetical protein QU38_02835, partial [Staphylococcus aureus]
RMGAAQGRGLERPVHRQRRLACPGHLAEQRAVLRAEAELDDHEQIGDQDRRHADAELGPFILLGQAGERPPDQAGDRDRGEEARPDRDDRRAGQAIEKGGLHCRSDGQRQGERQGRPGGLDRLGPALGPRDEDEHEAQHDLQQQHACRDRQILVTSDIDQAGLADRAGRGEHFGDEQDAQRAGADHELLADQPHHAFGRQREHHCQRGLGARHPEADLAHLLGDRGPVVLGERLGDDGPQD